MACENDSASSNGQTNSSESTRRRMLAIIPAALFAGWRGLGMRPKTGTASANSSPPLPPRAPDQSIPTYSYDRVSDSADGEAYCYEAICTTVTTFDDQGNVIEHRTILPDGSATSHRYCVVPPHA